MNYGLFLKKSFVSTVSEKVCIIPTFVYGGCLYVMFSTISFRVCLPFNKVYFTPRHVSLLLLTFTINSLNNTVNIELAQQFFILYRFSYFKRILL